MLEGTPPQRLAIGHSQPAAAVNGAVPRSDLRPASALAAQSVQQGPAPTQQQVYNSSPYSNGGAASRGAAAGAALAAVGQAAEPWWPSTPPQQQPGSNSSSGGNGSFAASATAASTPRRGRPPAEALSSQDSLDGGAAGEPSDEEIEEIFRNAPPPDVHVVASLAAAQAAAEQLLTLGGPGSDVVFACDTEVMDIDVRWGQGWGSGVLVRAVRQVGRQRHCTVECCCCCWLIGGQMCAAIAMRAPVHGHGYLLPANLHCLLAAFANFGPTLLAPPCSRPTRSRLQLALPLLPWPRHLLLGICGSGGALWAGSAGGGRPPPLHAVGGHLAKWRRGAAGRGGRHCRGVPALLGVGAAQEGGCAPQGWAAVGWGLTGLACKRGAVLRCGRRMMLTLDADATHVVVRP